MRSLVEAQVHRVGAQPVAGARRFVALAEQAQRGAGRGGKAAGGGQRGLEGAARMPLAAGAGRQPAEAGRGEAAERALVGRFGPDQFGDEQGEVHEGDWKAAGKALECTIAVFATQPTAAWPCPTNC